MQPIVEYLKTSELFAQARSSIPRSSTNGQENSCPVCRGSTWVPMPNGSVKRCECQLRKIAEERIRVVLRDWPEYAEAKLETLRPRNVGQQNALEAIRGNPSGSYFLSGFFSRGKTHLLVAQYRQLALAGKRCVLRSARDLMEELRKAEAPPDANREVFESPVLQLVNLAPEGHLFIDDIEKAPARSGFRQEMLFDLFDTIKRRQLGLTITSNLPLISQDQKKPDLRSALGDHAVSRLYRICQVMEL